MMGKRTPQDKLFAADHVYLAASKPALTAILRPRAKTTAKPQLAARSPPSFLPANSTLTNPSPLAPLPLAACRRCK